jgi:uncharacterized protein (TIGR02300 family)
MANAELGTKRVCVACGARFYDLQRSPAICPKCGTEQPPDQPRLRRPPGPPAEDKRPKKPVVVPGLDEAEAAAVEDEAEEDVLEDTSDLEDDAEIIGGDIEVEPESDEKDL